MEDYQAMKNNKAKIQKREILRGKPGISGHFLQECLLLEELAKRLKGSAVLWTPVELGDLKLESYSQSATL